MSTALWYQHWREHGETPHCRRLSRVPMRYQWRAALTLAIERARVGGMATVCSDRCVTMTGELYVYAPALDDEIPDDRRVSRRPTGWWLIPRRVWQRTMRLYDRAIMTACRQGDDSRARPWDVESVLRRWATSGQWRRIISDITPRHSPASPDRRRWRERRGSRPARKPRDLP